MSREWRRHIYGVAQKYMMGRGRQSRKENNCLPLHWLTIVSEGKQRHTSPGLNPREQLKSKLLPSLLTEASGQPGQPLTTRPGDVNSTTTRCTKEELLPPHILVSSQAL